MASDSAKNTTPVSCKRIPLIDSMAAAIGTAAAITAQAAP